MKRSLNILAFAILLIPLFLINNPKGVSAEIVVVRADQAWQQTDIILKKNHVINWKVSEDDNWSFNTAMFPDGHNADGIPVPALESYALPGENIGMLLGKTDENMILTMGLSGSVPVLPGEEGNYLYLTMNDDLIGKFGEGFRDNNDVITVTITQTPRKVVNIGILFIEGCPGVSSVTDNIIDIIGEETVDADITLMLIETLEDAKRLQFAGSPTVRINGRDVDSNMKTINDYGLKSRHYYVNGKKMDYPSKSMIREAINKVK
ncbi:MAG: hypothetical protein R2568_08635 [Candidatus Scalindua sp.]|jgi:hypothetical protein|nr:hypothetical protein [Candidatus Scalindua sp.]MDV5166798.1 hypothetical protein [Candidatus Scalindua sp.]